MQTLDDKFANINTCPNKNGVFSAIKQGKNKLIIATLGAQPGKVQILIDNGHKQEDARSINAHNGEIAQLALTQDARMVATASDKGTTIRFFDLENGQKLHEVRRGKDYVQI